MKMSILNRLTYLEEKLASITEKVQEIRRELYGNGEKTQTDNDEEDVEEEDTSNVLFGPDFWRVRVVDEGDDETDGTGVRYFQSWQKGVPIFSFYERAGKRYYAREDAEGVLSVLLRKRQVIKDWNKLCVLEIDNGYEEDDSNEEEPQSIPVRIPLRKPPTKAKAFPDFWIIVAADDAVDGQEERYFQFWKKNQPVFSIKKETAKRFKTRDEATGTWTRLNNNLKNYKKIADCMLEIEPGYNESEDKG